MKITLALLCLTAAVTSNTLFSLEQPLYRAARQVPPQDGRRPEHNLHTAADTAYGGAPVSTYLLLYVTPEDDITMM